MRSFPFDALPEVPASIVPDLRRWARALPFTRLSDTPWLGHTTRIRMGAPSAHPPAHLQPAAGVLFECGRARFAWRLGPALAGQVLERSLGGESGPPLHGPLGEVERGVLTYALASWVAPSAWVVADVFTHGPALSEALGEGALHRWPMTLWLDEHAYDTELWLNLRLPTPPPAPARRDDLPVTCVVLGGRGTLPAGAIARLGEGDVVVLDRVTVDGHGDGEVELVVRATEHALRATRAAGTLTIASHASWAPGGQGQTGEKGMSTPMDGMHALPVALSLELARFELPLADVSALAPGEVVRTGQQRDSRVALRAGDRVVAIGELVVVDDEIGVRITEIPTTPG